MPEPTSFGRFFVDEAITEENLLKLYAEHVLAVCGGNKTKAARLLGIDRRSLYRRLGLCLDKREGSHAAGDRSGNE